VNEKEDCMKVCRASRKLISNLKASFHILHDPWFHSSQSQTNNNPSLNSPDIKCNYSVLHVLVLHDISCAFE